MNATHQQLLADAYTAFNTRDIDRVLQSMHPDAQWPNGWEGGYVHGHEAIRAYWERQWAQIQPQVLPLRFVQESENRMAVDVQQTVHNLEGELLHQNLVQHVYELRNGLIQAMDIQPLAAG